MVASTISSQCQELRAGEPLTYRSLRVYPLLGPSRQEPAYALLTTQTQDDVVVTEVSEGGSEPTLRVKNRLKQRVLLIDGQELRGAKQNRIVNLDVLVPAGAELELPVTCVEQGRWGYLSRKFSPGKSAFRSMRSSKSSRVYESLKANRGPTANQGEVWRDVAEMHCCVGSSSPTGAMSDAYDHHDAELKKAREALKLPAEAVGFAVYSGDRFLGLDVFDRASTLDKSWETMVDGYLLDWIAFHASSDDATEKPADQCTVPINSIVASLSDAEWETFDTPGEGRDARWENDTLVGAALVWDDQSTVHLQLFPKEKRPTSNSPRSAGD
jgi:hypothetical protein